MKYSRRSRGTRPKRDPRKHEPSAVPAAARRRWYAETLAAHAWGVRAHEQWERYLVDPDMWVWTVEATYSGRGLIPDFQPVRVEQPEPSIPEPPSALRWRLVRDWLARR